jgi:hypothetical protein
MSSEPSASPAKDTGQLSQRHPSSLGVKALGGWIEWLRDLYEGDSPQAHRFRYGLLAFDVATVLFIVVTSFLPRYLVVEVLDVCSGLPSSPISQPVCSSASNAGETSCIRSL